MSACSDNGQVEPRYTRDGAPVLPLVNSGEQAINESISTPLESLVLELNITEGSDDPALYSDPTRLRNTPYWQTKILNCKR